MYFVQASVILNVWDVLFCNVDFRFIFTHVLNYGFFAVIAKSN